MVAINKSSLETLGDIFRFAVRRFKAARLAYGHGTTNARDEAAFLVLEGLRLPIDLLEPYLDLHPTPRERARLLGREPSRGSTTRSCGSVSGPASAPAAESCSVPPGAARSRSAPAPASIWRTTPTRSAI